MRWADPERWLKRADECRAIAEDMAYSPEARAAMLKVAEDYEAMAARAEDWLKRHPQDAPYGDGV